MLVRVLPVVLLCALPLILPGRDGAGPEVLPGTPAVSGHGDERIARGDMFHQQFRPLEALELFEDVLAEDPLSYPALWRAARETVSLGMLAASDDDARRWYVRGEGYARRAVEAGPGRTEGHQWLAIALGRRALREGPRTRVRLAEEVRAEALQILELDPENAGGHHVLGQWNAEVMRLRGVTRALARGLLGGASFDQASWDSAVNHLTRATERAPEGLIHHFELALVHLDLGDRESARTSLRTVMDRPALEPIDPQLKQRAQEILKTL